MGIRVPAVILVFTSLIIVAPAAAQVPPCVNPILATFGPYLEDVADVIVVLKPSVDYPSFNGPERVAEGEIQRIEKGVAPDTIVITMSTLWAGLRAGVPARLFLKKFSAREAHYIIGGGSLPDLPREIAISVTAGEGPVPRRVFRPGSTVLIEGQITTPASAATSTMDVYGGIIRPNGSTAWLTGTVFAPTFTDSALPLPFLAGVPEKTMSFGATYRLQPNDPPGWYVLFGLVARPRSDSRDPCWWQDTYVFPLLVEPEPR